MLKNNQVGGSLRQRNSNIEILRIFSMILIIAYHFVSRHSNVEADTTFVFIVEQILGSWGILGVDLK